MVLETLKHIFANLKHRKGRSLMISISIMIGIMTISVLALFGEGLTTQFDEIFAETGGMNKIQIRADYADDRAMFTENDLEFIENIQGVSQLATLYYDSVEVKDAEKTKPRYVDIATIPDEEEKIELIRTYFASKVVDGRFLEPGDTSRVIVGSKFADDDGIFDKAVKVGDKLLIDEKKFKIVGILKEIGDPESDSVIMMNQDYYKKIYSKDDTYRRIIVETDKTADTKKVADEIERKLLKRRNLDSDEKNFRVTTLLEMIERQKSILNMINKIVMIIAGISLLVSAINTANFMYISVYERKKEIGIMKAIGATNFRIFNQFLVESSFIGFFSGVFGVLLGVGVSMLGAKILSGMGYSFIVPGFNPIIFIALVSFSTFIGAMSGALPARHASKARPAEVLREK